ncbi:MAG: DedA family protein [Myxococcaceae bacterium]
MNWVTEYGYYGLAVGVFLESAGVPVPGETVLVAAAIAAAHGWLSLPWVIAVAALAGALGDNLGYALGRKLGRPFAERHLARILSRSRLERVDRFFARYGPAAVALARFVAGLRVVAALSAGMARLRWSLFLPFNLLGAALWATSVGLAGYAAGLGWRELSGWRGRTEEVLVPVVLLALIMLVRWWVHRRRKRRGPALRE